MGFATLARILITGSSSEYAKDKKIDPAAREK